MGRPPRAGTSKAQLESALEEVRKGAAVNSDTGDQQFEALQKYGTDLTAKAAQLDPIIGRDEEIRRVVRILCRRTKNNPVLIGDPGRGCPATPCPACRSLPSRLPVCVPPQDESGRPPGAVPVLAPTAPSVPLPHCWRTACAACQRAACTTLQESWQR